MDDVGFVCERRKDEEISKKMLTTVKVTQDKFDRNTIFGNPKINFIVIVNQSNDLGENQ